MRKAIVGLLVLAVLGALGFWGLTSPAAYGLIRGGDAVAPAANRQPDLENGRTLFYAGGCTSGHGIMGLSALQWPSLVAVATFFAAGILSAHFLLPFILSL